MKKIFILGGGGTLGSCIAAEIARKSLADETVLYDVYESAAKHHAFDIQEAVCMDGHVKVRAGGYEDIAGSDLIVNAAGLPVDWVKLSGAENIRELKPVITELARKTAALAPDAVVISVTNPLDPVNYWLWKCSGLERRQFIGCSFNDTVRLRKGIAAFLGKDACDVEAYVLGCHNKTKVSIYSRVNVCGEKAEFSKEDIEQIESDMAVQWKEFLDLGIKRTAGWTTASCVGKYIQAIDQGSDEIFPCSVIPEEGARFSDVSIGLTVRLGHGGVQEILMPPLTADEEEKLEASASWVRSVIKQTESLF